MKKKLWILLISLLILTPLGLLTENPAWGEWETEYYQKMLGFIPKGIANAMSIKPIIPDYSISNVNSVFGYYISAIVGLFSIYFIFFILTKIYSKKSSENN